MKYTAAISRLLPADLGEGETTASSHTLCYVYLSHTIEIKRGLVNRFTFIVWIRKNRLLENIRDVFNYHALHHTRLNKTGICVWCFNRL
jgi:hypothetical protein